MSRNIYTYEVTLVCANSQQHYFDVKATSELAAVIEAVRTHAPVYEVVGVSRVR